MNIALVHDYLVQYGGAERVLERFVRLFPGAPVYTLIYDRAATGGHFDGCDIRTSFLQDLPLAASHHRLFPALMPLAIEQFDLSRYDVVLSDSSSYAKGIITSPETLHISYVHTPMRYAWDDCQKYTQDSGFPTAVKSLVPFAMNGIRVWDRVSTARVDRFVANSRFVARRIRKYYGAEATVIHPPVDVDRFRWRPALADPVLAAQGYMVMVGRLIPYKRHDIVIAAVNRCGMPLKIIGRGPEEARLRRLAGPTVEFLTDIDDDALARYYANARAFIFPQEEDFGIVAIEAMAAGRPIIAYRGGDIVEHVEDGVTGMFFDAQTPEAIAAALTAFRPERFDPALIAAHAARFDKSVFDDKITRYVAQAAAAHAARPIPVPTPLSTAYTV